MMAEFFSNYKKNSLFSLPLFLMEISCTHLPALRQISDSQAVPANAGLARKLAATEAGMRVQGWGDGTLTLVFRSELQQMSSFPGWFPNLKGESVTSPQVSV